MTEGAYVLKLVCDAKNCGTTANIRDEYGSVCRKAAIRRGWHLSNDGRCYCPACTRLGSWRESES